MVFDAKKIFFGAATPGKIFFGGCSQVFGSTRPEKMVFCIFQGLPTLENGFCWFRTGFSGFFSPGKQVLAGFILVFGVFGPQKADFDRPKLAFQGFSAPESRFWPVSFWFSGFLDPGKQILTGFSGLLVPESWFLIFFGVGGPRKYRFLPVFIQFSGVFGPGSWVFAGFRPGQRGP